MNRLSRQSLPPPPALAAGAIALGALALGAIAIGYLAINNLQVKRALIRRLEIDDLIINRIQRLSGATGFESEWPED